MNEPYLIWHLSELKGGEASGLLCSARWQQEQGPPGWCPNGKVAHPKWSADLISRKFLKKEGQSEVDSGLHNIRMLVFCEERCTQSFWTLECWYSVQENQITNMLFREDALALSGQWSTDIYWYYCENTNCVCVTETQSGVSREQARRGNWKFQGLIRHVRVPRGFWVPFWYAELYFHMDQIEWMNERLLFIVYWLPIIRRWTSCTDCLSKCPIGG